MKFTVEQTNLMCIHGAGTNTRQELINELEEMKTHLQEDEVELSNLTNSTLEILYNLTDLEFDEVSHELVADFL